MEKLFELFIDKKSTRFGKPFYNPKYDEVWATDGHILLTIKNCEYKDNIIELTKPVSNEERIVRKITIDDLQKKIQKVRLEDEVERVVCEDCGGSGEVTWRYGIYEMEDTCPICNGDGWTRERKTGKKVFAKDETIVISCAEFKPKYIKVLIEAMQMLNIDKITQVARGKNTANIFRFNDNIEVLLMPLFSPKI